MRDGRHAFWCQFWDDWLDCAVWWSPNIAKIRWRNYAILIEVIMSYIACTCVMWIPITGLYYVWVKWNLLQYIKFETIIKLAPYLLQYNHYYFLDKNASYKRPISRWFKGTLNENKLLRRTSILYMYFAAKVNRMIDRLIDRLHWPTKSPSLTHSLARSLARSLTHSLARSLARSLTHSHFTYWIYF